MSEKYDPIISQRNTSNEINSINSNQIGSSRNKKKIKNNNKTTCSNNKKNTGKNKNNKINIITINNTNNNTNTDIKVSDNNKFGQYLNLPKEINNNQSYELYLKLHKFFLKIIAKKAFLKNVKMYKQEGDNLFKLCVQKIYTSNEMLSKVEQSCKIKYVKNGYKEFYPNITQDEEEKMKYIPNVSKTIDNSIIISYNSLYMVKGIML